LDVLAAYSSTGLPTPDDDDVDDDDEDADESSSPRRSASSLFSLERGWTDVVRDHEALDKRQRDYQEAVWELLSTELDHISKLRVVVDVRRTRSPALAVDHRIPCILLLLHRNICFQTVFVIPGMHYSSNSSS